MKNRVFLETALNKAEIRTNGKISGIISLKSLLTIVLWFTLVSGLLEIILLTYLHVFVSPIMELSPDYVWMTPLGLLVTTLVATTPFFILKSFWKHSVSSGLVLFVACTILVLEFLLFVPGMHHFVLLTLALGVSVHLARVMIALPERFICFSRKTTPWLIFVLVVITIVSRGGSFVSERQAISSLTSAPTNAPNVILISLDTVRAANLSLYGYSRPTSPWLEEFAQEGVVFDHALASAPWTLPSHATMFTGKWHHEQSVGWESPLDKTDRTLAEFLSSRGYHTGAFIANMRYVGYETGLDRGFIHFEDYVVSFGQFIMSSKLLRTITNNFRLRRVVENDQHIERKSAEHLNPAVLEWTSNVEDRPFFLFVNYFDAHEPYLAPHPYSEAFGPPRQKGKYSPLHRWLYEPAVGHSNLDERAIQEEKDAYDGTLIYLDNQLGRLFEELNTRGKLDNTLVIITADHGEEFGEHNVFEHGNSLYRASVEVPLILHFPGVVPKGVRISETTTIRNLPATVIDLLGLEGSPFQGRSYSQYWTIGDGQTEEEPIFSTLLHVSGHPDWFPVSKGNMHSVTIRGMRYILNGDGTEELYDFSKDLWEKENLVKSELHTSTLEEAREIVSELVENTEAIP